MKKAICLLLSIMLLFSCFASVILTTSSADGASADIINIDFEADSDVSKYTAKLPDTASLGLETENAIGGNKSIKVSFNGGGGDSNRGGFYIGAYNTSKTYRITVKYRITSGALGYLRVINPGGSTIANLFPNLSLVADTRVVHRLNAKAEGVGNTITFSGIIKPEKASGTIALAMQPTKATTGETTVLFDDITLAEIVTVTAESEDTAKGTVTVTNGTNAEFTDFAAGETARFVATSNTGYDFSHWENEEGTQVSDQAIYNHLLTETKTNLKAVFKKGSAAKKADSKVFDFETQEDFAALSGMWPTIANMEETTDGAISGNKSLKTYFTAQGANNANGRGGFSLGNFDPNKTYRITIKYKITSGTLGMLYVINPDKTTGESLYPNLDKIDSLRYIKHLYNKADSNRTQRTITGLIKPSANNGNISVALRPTLSSATGATVLFDDITVSEIVEVTATSEDSAKGSATVSNGTNTENIDYAAGEIAVFTATPQIGYVFSHWEDADGVQVSTDAKYSHIITHTPTSLKAVFKEEPKAEQHLFDFEADNDVNKYTAKLPTTASIGLETENAIGGNKSLKVTFNGGGGDSNRGGFYLGTFSAAKTYRITVKYRITSGALGYLRVINPGGSTIANLFPNLSLVADTRVVHRLNAKAEGVGNTITFSGIIKPEKASGTIALAMQPTKATTGETTVLFDDITLAEIVTVTAESEDNAKGTVTVTNGTNSAFTDFAAGETAKFCALPKSGYEFSHWEDADCVQISSESTFNYTLTKSEFALKAIFKEATKPENYLFDFEKASDFEALTGLLPSIAEMSEVTGDVIAGNKSLEVKFSSNGANNSNGRGGFSLGNFNPNKTYRISIKYRITSGTLGMLYVINPDKTTGESLYPNLDKINSLRYIKQLYNSADSNRTERVISGVIKPSSNNGNISVALRPTLSSATGATVLFDDIEISEVNLINVNAVANNEAMGSVTISNKTKPAFTNFSYGEVAELTAKAKRGYKFTHWQSASGVYSTDETISITVNNDINLTACFVVDETVIKPSAVGGSYLIDFDTPNTGVNATFDHDTEMGIRNKISYNGKPTNVLHIFAGDHASVTDSPAQINPYTTYNNQYGKADTDETFSFDVRGGYAYSLSFRVKVESNSTYDPSWSWAAVTIYSGGQTITNGKGSINIYTSARGVWKEYSTIVTIPNGQNRASISANFGSKTPDIYVDDILVEELGKGFTGYDGPQKETLITFDDYIVNLTGVGQEITKAPERDGKSTNAIHIIPGSYNEAVALNYNNIFSNVKDPETGESSTVVKHQDPLFSIPVKENTFYRWSCWVYITPEQERFNWHAFYPIAGDTGNAIYRVDEISEDGQWFKLEKSFITKAGQNYISLYYNFGKNPRELFIDDFSLIEVQPGTLYNTSLAYTAQLYNLINADAINKEISKSTSGAIKIAVKASTPHTFSAIVSGSNKTKLYFSQDGVTPMNKSFSDSVDGIMTPKSSHYSFEFIPDSSGYVYLMFENPDKTLKLENPFLFATTSRSGNRPMGFEEDPNTETPKPELIVEDASMYGKNPVIGGDGTSPSTGDGNNLTTIFIILISAIGMLFISYRKGMVKKNG